MYSTAQREYITWNSEGKKYICELNWSPPLYQVDTHYFNMHFLIEPSKNPRGLGYLNSVNEESEALSI